MSRAKVRVCGPFLLDEDVPPDEVGRGVCRVCHLVGHPGDAHHPLPDVAEQAEHRRRAGDEP